MSSQEKIAPCPFCGKVPIGPEYHDYDGWRVRCDVLSCMAKVDLRDTEAQAVSAWNRRPVRRASSEREKAREAVIEAAKFLRDELNRIAPMIIRSPGFKALDARLRALGDA